MPAEIKPVVETVVVRAYAIRRVNPFLGVLQVIETEGGRAISANGVVWESRCWRNEAVTAGAA